MPQPEQPMFTDCTNAGTHEGDVIVRLQASNGEAVAFKFQIDCFVKMFAMGWKAISRLPIPSEREDLALEFRTGFRVGATKNGPAFFLTSGPKTIAMVLGQENAVQIRDELNRLVGDDIPVSARTRGAPRDAHRAALLRPRHYARRIATALIDPVAVHAALIVLGVWVGIRLGLSTSAVNVDWLPGALEHWTLAVLVLTGIVVGWQAWETRKSASAARESANVLTATMKVKERPLLAFTVTDAVVSPSQPFQCKIQVANLGTVIARNVVISHNVIPGDAAFAQYDPVNAFRGGESRMTAVIPPGMTHTLTVRSPRPLPREFVEGLGPNSALVIAIRAAYDGYLEKGHVTTKGLIWEPLVHSFVNIEREGWHVST